MNRFASFLILFVFFIAPLAFARLNPGQQTDDVGDVRGVDGAGTETPPPVERDELFGDNLGPGHAPPPFETPRNPKLDDEGQGKLGPNETAPNMGGPREGPKPGLASTEGRPEWDGAWLRFRNGEIDAEEYRRLSRLRAESGQGYENRDDGFLRSFGMTSIDHPPDPDTDERMKKDAPTSIIEEVESVIPIA